MTGRTGQKLRMHGLSRTPEYQVWHNMIARCEDTNNVSYADYGGRGIRVCDRWKLVENFYADMAPRPSADHMIERINNDGPYEPANCRWATRSEQMKNRRQRTHCIRGHEFTTENTRVYRGERYCRTCSRDRMRTIRANRRSS